MLLAQKYSREFLFESEGESKPEEIKNRRGKIVMELEDPTMAESTIKLTIKFGGKSIPLSVSPDCTIKDVKSLLQPITNVLPRGQKLIFKGF